MFADASALTAIMTDEADARELLERVQAYETRETSALAVWETTVAVARILKLSVAEATAHVENYLREINVVTIEIGKEHTHLALEAFDRFGKGRHPAQLNFGDCFAYACAKRANVPLLFKGRDFGLTDIRVA